MRLLNEFLDRMPRWRGKRADQYSAEAKVTLMTLHAARVWSFLWFLWRAWRRVYSECSHHDG